MKDEFLATLSHELRTPLNAILGWAHILQRGRSAGDELAKGLSVIERNARAQAQIIEDLLDMSRIISGKIRLDVQRLELSDVVQSALETARPAAEGKGIALDAVLDPLAMQTVCIKCCGTYSVTRSSSRLAVGASTSRSSASTRSSS
jgi:signal transduction histidine kinase